MSMLGAIIVPHPPIIMPQVGNGKEKEMQATIDGYRAAAAEVAKWNPDLLVIACPHSVTYADYFHIAPGEKGHGDMDNFGVEGINVNADYDEEFRAELIHQAEEFQVPAGTEGEKEPAMDHSVWIPIHFLQEAGVNCPVLRLSLSGLSPLGHYAMGQCIAQTAEVLNRRVVFVASGDLSHRMKEDGPFGFAPESLEFDRQIGEAIESADFFKMMTMDPELCSKAEECGMRAFQIMAGTLDGLAVEPKLLSHESPFGVGYAVATYKVTGEAPERTYFEAYVDFEDQRLADLKASEDPWTKLARLALETYVTTGARPELPKDLPAELLEKSYGCYVSLHNHGRLRGCVGNMVPAGSKLTVADTIIEGAIATGTKDERFPAVVEEELPILEYSVDVISKPEEVESFKDLDVKRYGIIVSNGSRSHMILPGMDGVDTPDQQVEMARQKAHIEEKEPCTIERFELIRHY